jgi:H+-transporting ATPase
VSTPLEKRRSGHQRANVRTAAAALASLGSNAESGLSTAEAQARLNRDGANDVPEERRHPARRLAHKFWGLSAWMLELIAALSFALGKYGDFWIAAILLVVNALLSFFQEQRASAALTALRSRLRVTAPVLRDGAWQTIPSRDLVRGDVVRLRSGGFIPADMLIISGDLSVDQSALTGETREIRRSADDILYSGSIVRRGEATGVVTETGVRTYFGRTTDLVESARPKLHVEEVITRVVGWLFLIVGTLVAITVAISLAEGRDLIQLLLLSLVLLMSAIPVALPVMFTVSMAVGSMELAHHGVLVTRLSAAEDAATMDMVCADKTGTLTMNWLSLAGVEPQPGYVSKDVIQAGALASNEADQDPIDLAFLHAARQRNLLQDGTKILSFLPFSRKRRRTEAIFECEERRVKVVKGALRTIAELAGLDASSITALEQRANEAASKGYRVIAVARGEEGASLRLVGIALLYDAPRPDSRLLIDELKSLGVGVKMLTGDALPVAREIAQELGLGEIVRAPELRGAEDAHNARARHLVTGSSGFAEVFPEDKFLVVKCLQEAGHIVGMTGDGFNDAPALRQAEVGIAVTGATDVAKGAASVVLTTEGLASIVNLVKNGRSIYQRVLTWIINKISSAILQAGLVVVGFLLTGKFVITALGMVLLVFMTDFVKIALSTDQAQPSQKPESWNIGPLVALAVLLGLLMLVEALGLLYAASRAFHVLGYKNQLYTFTFESLLFFAAFSIVLIRERRRWWASRPSAILSIALFGDACAGIAVAAFGLGELHPLQLPEMVLIVAYSLLFSLIVNDFIKTAFIARYWSLTAVSTAR